MEKLKEILDLRTKLTKDEKYKGMLDDMINYLVDIIGDPKLMTEEEWILKSMVIEDTFASRFRYDYMCEVDYRPVKDDPDPADVEEDESEHDTCIVSDIAYALYQEFDVDNHSMYKIIGTVYYEWNRNLIREDWDKGKEYAIEKAREWLRNNLFKWK